MRLDNLYNNSRLLLKEGDTGQSLEPSRYPAVRRHILAKRKPTLNMEEEVEKLKNMAFEYSRDQDPSNYDEAVVALRRSQAAFARLLQQLQVNPISGLRGANSYDKLSSHINETIIAKTDTQDLSKYIVIAADVDDMGHINNKTGLGHPGGSSILQTIGGLFEKFFNIENTKLFHPSGDEFRVVTYIGDADVESARIRFSQLLRGCIELSNYLTSSGFYLEGWTDDHRVQPTISFGISTSDDAADGLLTHVKIGASGRKPMKYVVVIDRDLRNNLGFSADELNKYVNAKSVVDIMTADTSDMVHEDKSPMNEVQGAQGAVIAEASYSAIPEGRRRVLNATRKHKRLYLEQPGGVLREGKNYYPLNEPFKSSQ